MKIFTSLSLTLLCLCPTIVATAQTADNDTTKTLNEVVIEATMQSTTTKKSTYVPTGDQRNSSQTAIDLLSRLGIPQLNVTLGSDEVKTNTGKDVAVYIDNTPATADELSMMRTADVIRVEYYDHPSDPRFQGNDYVINYIMRKQEFGGYFKTMGYENFIGNSGQLQLNTRFNYKRMTYDVMGYGFYCAHDHTGLSEHETFRLPQDDGTESVFDRYTESNNGKFRRQVYQTAFRAKYASDNIVANNRLSFGLNRTPHDDNSGSVTYTPEFLPDSRYTLTDDRSSKFVNFDGYYNFILPKGNTLTATAQYSYSTTDQDRMYVEEQQTPIDNRAIDNSSNAALSLSFGHKIGAYSLLNISATGKYGHNHTNYFGSLIATDRTTTKYGQASAKYSFSKDKYNVSASFGWAILDNTLNDSKYTQNHPFADVSLKYSLNRKNSMGAYFHYASWPPSSGYKSENVIQVSPLMWRTGNPYLDSERSYDFGVDYTYLPSNRLFITLFATSYINGNRSAFVYQPTEYGLLRTIAQPIGSYGTYSGGVNASLKLFNDKLHLYGQLVYSYTHDSEPFNHNRSILGYYAQATYYLKHFYFAGAYKSRQGQSPSSMAGYWVETLDHFILQGGWSNSNWNIKLHLQNFHRWGWRHSKKQMQSRYYDDTSTAYGVDYHALVQLKATYTFGFGKKVNRGDDLNITSGADSGILK